MAKLLDILRGSRRVGRTVAQPPASDAVGVKQMAFQTVAPAVPQFSQAGIGGTAGWRPMPGQAPGYHADQQIGAYAGSMLNQFPALLPGMQLLNGREGGYSGYYTPTAFPVTNGGLSQTQNPSNVPGGQRWGQAYGGPLGPISVAQLRANVTAQQVRQSGLAAMSWAKGLSPTYVDGGN